MESLVTRSEALSQSDREEKASLVMSHEAQVQWLEARPRQVKWLRENDLLRLTLKRMVRDSANQCVALREAGVPPLEAQREATTRLLYLPDEESVPRLPEELAPYGQVFIRAEIVHYEDLMECGSVSEARKRGVLRQEGKDYIVKDGDVMRVLFNV